MSETTPAFRWNLAYYIIQKFQLTGAAQGLVFAGCLLLCIVIPYLLGSFNFGLIISHRKYKDDIRNHGSGNAGTTNMLRVYGTKAAALTLLGDMAKAALAVGFGYLVLNFQQVPPGATAQFFGGIGEKPGAAVAGLFVMLGHMFPCFYKFKGGKGVATIAMVILMLNPLVFLILLAVFVVVVVGTRYVSLGSVMGVCLYPIILSAFEQGQGSYIASGIAVVMAVLVVYKHRENLKRLKDGKESKISFKKKSPAEEVAEPSAPSNKKARKKQKYQEEQAQKAADQEAIDKYQYVKCTGCGSLIPQSRKVCAYCNTPNAQYVPDPEDAGAKAKKKRSK